MTDPRLDPRSLAPLFRPASVAVIGASSDPTKLGSIPIGHMKASGFKGPLYPINPKAATIQDLPAYASVRAVPGPVDLAIIAVPEPLVLPALRDCAAKGVRAVVLFTSGFAEVSAAGRRAQEEIKALARGAGMRLLGPNCMGLVNFANGLVATFHLAFGPGLAPAGRIGLITQSGAFGGVAYQVAQDRALGYSLILTTGNEGDVEVERALHDIGELVAVMDMRREGGTGRRLDHGHVHFGRRGARQIGMLQHVAFDLLLRLEPLRRADAKPDTAQQRQGQLKVGPHLAPPPLFDG